MSRSKTYHVRPSKPFTAYYPLTIADSLMVQLDSVYLYIFSTSSPLRPVEKDQLIDVLTRSLSTFFQHPERSDQNLPEVLGTIYDDAATGYLTVKVTPSSSVPFIVSDRSASSGTNVVHLQDLQPESSFPCQPLLPSIIGQNSTIPPPDAIKQGVQALWIQLTFLEGGFVIHLHIHHWIAGAMGAARFVEGWLERARLLASTSLAANLDDTVIARSTNIKFGDREELTDSISGVTVPQQDHPDWNHVPGGRRIFGGMHLNPILLGILLRLYMFVLTYLSFLLPRVDAQMFHFSPEALRRLQMDIQQTGTEAPEVTEGKAGALTANDCLSALLWTCITRARFGTSESSTQKDIHQSGTSSSLSSTMMTAVDYRSRLNPPLHPNFFGNSNVDVYPTLPISVLLSASRTPFTTTNTSTSSSSSSPTTTLKTPAQTLHQTISAVTDPHIRSLYQLITSRPRLLDSEKCSINFNFGTDLICTNWERVHQDPKLLELDILPKHNGTRIRFEKLRFTPVASVDGVMVVFPAYGRKWGQSANGNGHGSNREEKGWDEGQVEGQASRQTGLEVAIGLKRTTMRRLMADEIFRRYATWGENGGYAPEVSEKELRK